MRRITSLLTAALFAVTIASSAAAQTDPNAADVETARAAFLQGLDLRDNRHDLAAALARFKAAYALVPTARIGFELGRTLRMMGDLVGARVAFIGATQLPQRPNESAESKKARTDADAQSNELDAHIPQLMIHLTGTGQIYVDGEPMRRDALAVARRLNPGAHVVQVQVEGAVRGERTVTLRDGEHAEVTMSAGAQAQVTIVANPPPPPNVVVDNPPLTVPNPEFRMPTTVHRNNAATKSALLYTASVLGGVGIIPGLLTLGYVKAAQDACAGGTCTSSFDSNKTLAYAFGITTDVVWGAAIICFVAAIAIPTTSEVTVGASALPGGGGILSASGRF